jgi:FdhD protein
MAEASRLVEVTRVRGGASAADVDRAATEEPLEIRLNGRPFVVTMRTPGADRELAAGFLLAERVIVDADDLGTIEHCADAAEEGRGNIVNVTLAGGAADRLERVLAARRLVTTTSSCGLCGRLTIESLQAEAPPIQSALRVTADRIASMPACLQASQEVFACTGGLHAAALFDADARLHDVAEDVGRHNAVDKVVGRMLLREALPIDNRVLFVSGRTSFEIVQKAFLAGIPVVASVSAPSTLAIDLARETHVTLVGFVRGDAFNIYSHAARVV